MPNASEGPSGSRRGDAPCPERRGADAVDHGSGGSAGATLVVDDLTVDAEDGRRLLHVPGLAVNPGEFVCIAGPSGAGKSTLLFALAGLLDRARGRVLWNGADVLAMSEGERVAFRGRHIGMVFQDFLLFDELGALANAAMGEHWRSGGERRAIERRARQLLLRLLSTDVYARLVARDEVALAAPLAFGDSVAGRPLVGTTATFVEHLAGAPREGSVFGNAGEAVVGSASGFELGERLHPTHGMVGIDEAQVHDGVELTVSGVLAPSGTPWDRAVIVPIETLWIAHGLGDGHGAGEGGSIGPPFDTARMPGVTAVVVRTQSLAGNYALRAAFTASDSMAFFPGEVLACLHSLLSDVRRVLSGMALLTEVLVVTAVTMALAILLAGLARRFAMLRALGAPRSFVFTVAWLHGLSTILAGALIGVPVGQLVAFALGWLLARESAVAVRPILGTADLTLVALFILCGALLVALPAWRLSGRRAMADLRG